jgi:2-dehydro-3-deoxygalactonokinase
MQTSHLTATRHNVVPIRPRLQAAKAAWVGVDWGLSHRRTYVYGADGHCLHMREDEEGMLAARGSFATSLDALLGALGVHLETPVLMSGMVGDAQGWREIPCLGADVPPVALAQHLVRLQGQRFVVPGYAQRRPHADLLRGEETHVLGLVLSGISDGWVVLPGAHSKWVCVKDGKVVRWTTFVTGELFESQRHMATLSSLLETRCRDDPFAFERGLRLAHSGMPLSQALFSVRASATMKGAIAAEHIMPMMSGVLIGAEFQGMIHVAPERRSLHLIASPSQAILYQAAADIFGWRVHAPDPHALYGIAIRHLYQDGVRSRAYGQHSIDNK